MKKIYHSLTLFLMVSFGLQSNLAYGMYRLTQGLKRGPILSFSRYKPMLKRLAVASGGLASLGGAAYGLQVHRKKLQEKQAQKTLEEQKRKAYEEKVRKFTQEWFTERLVEQAELKDSSSWWKYVQSLFTRKKVNKNEVDHDTSEALDEDIVVEAKMICDQLMPDMPVIGWETSLSSGHIITVSADIPTPSTVSSKIRFPIIGINPIVWKRASMEAKKAILAHEYGHWVYRSKHGFEISPSREEELFADQVAIELTGSVEGVLEFLQNGIMKFQFPHNIDKWSSQEMQTEIERLRFIDSRTLFKGPVHPIEPLRALLAIQHEKKLREQRAQREQTYFDEVVLPALTGA